MPRESFECIFNQLTTLAEEIGEDSFQMKKYDIQSKQLITHANLALQSFKLPSFKHTIKAINPMAFYACRRLISSTFGLGVRK